MTKNLTVIRVRTQNNFSIVPHALLEDLRLGDTAVRLACWLAGRSDNWEARKNQIKEALGFGEASWSRSVKELKSAGYLETAAIREGGRWAGQEYIFCAGGLERAAPAADGDENIPPPPKLNLPQSVSPSSARPSSVSHHSIQGRPVEERLVEETPPPQPTGARAAAGPVVVASEEDQAQLVWPERLTEDKRASMRDILLGKDWPGSANAQALLDELAGQMAVPGKVRNPPGLLRRLMERQRKGEFTSEFGLEVQQIREARRKQQEREAAALAAKSQGKGPAGPGPQGSGTSEAAKRELERQREKFPELAKRKAAKTAAHP